MHLRRNRLSHHLHRYSRQFCSETLYHD